MGRESPSDRVDDGVETAGMGATRHTRKITRARRGDVRAAALLLLAEAPANGYQLMQEIESRSGGAWRPSPGSMYPALARLERERLVRVEEQAGRRTLALSDAGRVYVEERRDALGSPWEEMRRAVADEVSVLFEELRAVSDRDRIRWRSWQDRSGGRGARLPRRPPFRPLCAPRRRQATVTEIARSEERRPV